MIKTSGLVRHQMARHVPCTSVAVFGVFLSMPVTFVTDFVEYYGLNGGEIVFASLNSSELVRMNYPSLLRIMNIFSEQKKNVFHTVCPPPEDNLC